MKLYRPNTGSVDGVSGRPLDRRGFLQATAKFLLAVPFLGLFSGSLLRLRPDFHQKAWPQRDVSAGPITVYKMVPLPGLKYGKAEMAHMANKIFPSIEAARARRPHGGFLYGLKTVPLPGSLVGGIDAYTLFCNRKDFDQRVRTDRHHWQRLGVDVDIVFGVIKNA